MQKGIPWTTRCHRPQRDNNLYILLLQNTHIHTRISSPSVVVVDACTSHTVDKQPDSSLEIWFIDKYVRMTLSELDILSMNRPFLQWAGCPIYIYISLRPSDVYMRR